MEILGYLLIGFIGGSVTLCRGWFGMSPYEGEDMIFCLTIGTIAWPILMLIIIIMYLVKGFYWLYEKTGFLTIQELLIRCHEKHKK